MSVIKFYFKRTYLNIYFKIVGNVCKCNFIIAQKEIDRTVACKSFDSNRIVIAIVGIYIDMVK